MNEDTQQGQNVPLSLHRASRLKLSQCERALEAPNFTGTNYRVLDSFTNIS